MKSTPMSDAPEERELDDAVCAVADAASALSGAAEYVHQDRHDVPGEEMRCLREALARWTRATQAFLAWCACARPRREREPIACWNRGCYLAVVDDHGTCTLHGRPPAGPPGPLGEQESEGKETKEDDDEHVEQG